MAVKRAMYRKHSDSTADDGWWLMRFTSSEMNTNLAIIDNTGGTQPVQDQNPSLRDGVTD